MNQSSNDFESLSAWAEICQPTTKTTPPKPSRGPRSPSTRHADALAELRVNLSETSDPQHREQLLQDAIQALSNGQLSVAHRCPKSYCPLSDILSPATGLSANERTLVFTASLSDLKPWSLRLLRGPHPPGSITTTTKILKQMLSHSLASQTSPDRRLEAVRIVFRNFSDACTPALYRSSPDDWKSAAEWITDLAHLERSLLDSAREPPFFQCRRPTEILERIVEKRDHEAFNLLFTKRAHPLISAKSVFVKEIGSSLFIGRWNHYQIRGLLLLLSAASEEARANFSMLAATANMRMDDRPLFAAQSPFEHRLAESIPEYLFKINRSWFNACLLGSATTPLFKTFLDTPAGGVCLEQWALSFIQSVYATRITDNFHAKKAKLRAVATNNPSVIHVRTPVFLAQVFSRFRRRQSENARHDSGGNRRVLLATLLSLPGQPDGYQDEILSIVRNADALFPQTAPDGPVLEKQFLIHFAKRSSAPPSTRSF